MAQAFFMHPPKSILIIRTDRIGDVVLTTPVIKALRDAYPQARVSILVMPLTKDLVVDNPYLDEIMVDDRKGEHKGLKGFLKLVSQLRQKKYDCALVLHTKKRMNALCFLAGIPQRIGYKNNKFGFFLTHPIKDMRHHGKKHESQCCLDVLKVLGIESAALEINISVQKESEQWMEAFCQEHSIAQEENLIAIHPGASDPAKCWPADRFAELIDALCHKYSTKVVIVGHSGIQPIAKKIMSQMAHLALDLTGKTTVSQLVSVLQRSDMLISNDSGPVHIAAGLETPVVSIFTRNQPGINPERWKPLGLKSKVVTEPFIKVTDVLEAVEVLFRT